MRTFRSHNTTIIRMWQEGRCYYIEFIWNDGSIYDRHLVSIYAASPEEARRKFKLL